MRRQPHISPARVRKPGSLSSSLTFISVPFGSSTRLQFLTMKLRIRICKQTSKVDLVGGPESTLKELMEHIRDVLLPGHGLGPDVTFGLSLNGAELLADTGQKLSSCGVVPGDLIRVLLPAGAAANSNDDSDDPRPGAGRPAGPVTVGPVAPTGAQTAAAAAAMTSSQPRTAAASPDAPPDQRARPTPATLSWEPMLCGEAGEGQAPLSLELLYRAAAVTCPADAIVVAAHLLMLETGFTPQGGEAKPGEMPSGWRSSGGAYRLQYTHTLCERGAVTVVAVPMNPALVIEAILQVADSASMAAKVCVEPAGYVTEAWPGASAASAFTGLSRLSRVFKDQLVYPLIAATREALCLPAAFGLAALPPELLLLVLRLLDVTSVVRLSAVCRRLNAAASDAALWRHLVRRDFSDHKWQGETNWKELYKSFYKFRQKRGAVERPCSLPPFIHRPLFGPVPFAPPRVPGIIGGAYDQRPPALPHGARYDPIGPPLPHGERRRRSDPRPPLGGRAPPDVRRGFI
ncbi:F-box only protein 7 isoform X2 [Syngnathus scovelli]|uniref:F-box only protein 7 isoform X2 n=1 Tax=Syngnathus scovelli TaxID=161590 RepID=UPI00210F8093|nr:F-box only protein 7 isoform X2 [Syngnathus scovelli]